LTQRTLFIRVGALLAFSVLLLIGVIILLTGDRWHPGHSYETYFSESVQGLDVGAPVKYRGVTLGHVYYIGLVSAEYGASVDEELTDPTYRLVVVRFKADPRKVGRLPDRETAVQTGLRAKLANQGLTGQMFLELDFVSPKLYPAQTVPWTPEADYIPSIPSTFAQVQDLVTDILHRLAAVDFGGVVTNLDGLISDLRHDVAPGGDVHAALAQATGTIADVQARIDAADLPGLAAQLRQTGAAITQLAQGPPTREAVADARAALRRLPKLIDSLTDVANRAGTGVEDAKAELIPILEDVRAAVENLRETTESIRRDPGGVLLQGPPPKDKTP
jgi:ABC-type transporter Mla subunit MlaD